MVVCKDCKKSEVGKNGRVCYMKAILWQDPKVKDDDSCNAGVLKTKQTAAQETPQPAKQATTQQTSQPTKQAAVQDTPKETKQEPAKTENTTKPKEDKTESKSTTVK